MIRTATTLARGVQRTGRTSRAPILSSTGSAFVTPEERNDGSLSNSSIIGWSSASPSPASIGFLSGNSSSFSSQRRFMSSSSSSSSAADTTATKETPNFDETMDKLFHESQREAQTGDDAWFLDGAGDAASDLLWEPTWWNFADRAVQAVNFMHDMTGLEYAGAIFATTCCIRLLILPVAVNAQRAASRMAHLQPELQLIKDRYEALGTPTQAEQMAFKDQMQGIFKRYEVNPFSAMAAPFVQAPIFLGMFFGMKKMPDLFHDQLATGGLWWFTDLTVPDPTYMLPVACGVTFLATIESSKEQMLDGNPKYGPVIINAFRAMCVVMVPVMTTFPAAMLCYWVPNNLITFVQSTALRNTWIKKQLGIWDRPKPLPGTATDAGFQETMQNLIKKAQGEPTTDKEKMIKHNEVVEAKKKVNELSKATRARRRRKR